MHAVSEGDQAMAWMVAGEPWRFGRPAGPFATHVGAIELKKLSVRHIRFVPVRKTLSLPGHLRTGATNADAVMSIPVSAAMNDLPPSVVRLIDPQIQAPIQSVSGRLDETATSASPHSR